MHRPSISILSSGSCGNSILLMSEGEGVMIDAGISCRELERRMSLLGIDPKQVSAVLLTHEHTDHNRGAQRFCTIHDVPVYGTEGTLSLTPLNGVQKLPISHRARFSIGSLSIKAHQTKHFAADPVMFSIACDGGKVGIASDLGCVTDEVLEGMAGSDLMLVEANYDDEMLMTGPYPEFLKQAIRGDHGHLSNDIAGYLAATAADERTGRIVLVHLSRENNTSVKARDAVESALRARGKKSRIHVVEHGAMAGPFEL